MENSFEKSQANFMGRTLLTMSAGLLVTFLVAIFTTNYIANINPLFIFAAFIGEIVLVIYLSRGINKMQVTTARMWFFVYAALNGFTFSLIFLSYNLNLLFLVFLITSGMFFCSAMIGITTKIDLSAMAQFFMMAVIGLVIMMVIQMIFQLSGLDMIIGFIGILVFCGLTAYDMQNIKKIHSHFYSISPEDTAKYSVISALRLYLDFINLFLFALRFLRNR